MKIKKLEIVGFKSFVDRTVVHFDHDILGIVGPNGCGKSNIVDAIRWCMGEQSAKHLRGRSMEDVIFNGSESRPASEYAEVTLTFENDGTDVPLEYRDYPEIAVSRRLTRSGDSDYIINKTPVRLKDVTDLFLGTGAGTRAYSIVEQGKIGLIVSAKPEDRRLLIEEAAGITKFKSRKKQAEKKMELTQQNLLRVGDIVAEIERSLGSLKRQAAKAERFLAYRQELEDLQLHEASHKFLELTGWIKLESGEVERLTLESDEAKGKLVTREAEMETVRLEALGAEDVLEKAQNENFAAENAVRAEEAAIERAKDRLGSLRAREEQASSEAAELVEQHERLAKEQATVTTEVEALGEEEQAFSTELGSEEDRLGELVAAEQDANRALGEVRSTASRAQASIASAEARLDGFERRTADMQDRMERLRLDQEDLQSLRGEHEGKAASLTGELEGLRQGKTLQAEEKVVLEAKLGELKGAIVASERSLDEAKGELSRKRSRLHALTEVQARLDGVGAGVKALVATKDPSLLGLVADHVEAPADFTQALAGFLGPRLSDVVVSDVARGAELLAGLASSRRGRATVVPVSPRHAPGAPVALEGTLAGDEAVLGHLVERLGYKPEHEGLVRSLVADTLVVRDVDAAVRILDEAFYGNTPRTLVTLDGTVFHADGRISGGQGEELAAGMLEGKREIRELGVEVERLDALVTERLEAHQTLRGAIGETQGALERARQSAHQSELALVTAEKDLQKAQAQVEHMARRLESIAGEVSQLETQLAEAGSEREGAQRTLDESRALADEAAGKLQGAEETAASWREQVTAHRQVVTERKVRLAGVREKVTAARGTLQRLTRSTEELAERAKRLEHELQQNAVAYGETAAALMKHREILGDALDAARSAANVLDAARGEFDAFRAKLAEAEAELKDLRQLADAARDELTAHEMNLRERSLALQHLVAGVAEKFRGLSLVRVIGDYHLRLPPDEEHRGRTQELVGLLERMGSVNLDAMREHEEAEKRFTFYSEQKEDLEKALADLDKAIQQMNRESKRLFEETFDAVNAKFQELFPKMFRGGRASLRLTNPDDMLETGIDILAQPPGKKLSSIELMSGGEKALTAVALIFSIFQIKPSPFCILDEVDAPLDEANVARYNDAIREMTDRSQFILITHIKRTMQLVDVLYGVTMPEAGVSKIVSVKMNETAEKRKPAMTGPAPDVAVA